MSTGRDHGLGTYLETRRQCGLKADFKCFQDLIEIFPQSYIDLLESVYDGVEDIDLIVGAALESYLSADENLFGETLSYIMKDQLKRSVVSDAYFYTNTASSNPHPFTEQQLVAIKNFCINSLICNNSGVSSVLESPFFVEGKENKQISCNEFKPMNLSAWKV